jgi:hypothetical protein
VINSLFFVDLGEGFDGLLGFEYRFEVFFGGDLAVEVWCESEVNLMVELWGWSV